MKYQSRNFEFIALQGLSLSLLPVFFHVENKYLTWLNDNSTIILKEFCNLIADNIEEITKKSFSEGSEQSSLVLVSGGEFICFAYNTENKQKSGIVLSFNEPNSLLFMRNLPVLNFTISAWIYPINDRPNIPVEML